MTMMGPMTAARRYFSSRREAREARRMDAEMQAHEAREQREADVKRRREAVLSGKGGADGGGGSYAIAQAWPWSVPPRSRPGCVSCLIFIFIFISHVACLVTTV